MLVATARHRFTASEFTLMGEAGVFGRNGRLELIEVSRDPMPDGYGHIERLTEPDTTLTPRRLPQLSLSVKTILG